MSDTKPLTPYDDLVATNIELRQRCEAAERERDALAAEVESIREWCIGIVRVFLRLLNGDMSADLDDAVKLLRRVGSIASEAEAMQLTLDIAAFLREPTPEVKP